MIRDRLKSTARKVLLRAFGMETDAADRTSFRPPAQAGAVDMTVIPKVVDGRGDTPGPNHKELIGRTWLAAQVIGGAPGAILDIRPPEEWTVGTLPGSILLPHHQVKSRLHLLPPKEVRITVVDATGSDDAQALAAWLRAEGWALARCLVGGWAEWVEHAEPAQTPTHPEGARFRLGDPVELHDGRRGVVQAVVRDGQGPARYTVLLDYQADQVASDVREEDLRG